VTSPPQAFVLIHGGYERGACFDRLAEMLRAAGHEVHAPDLPPNREVDVSYADVSLEVYSSYVTDVLSKIGRPAALVGHSLGGLTISMAAQRQPALVSRLVYLSALMVAPGDSVRSFRERFYGPGSTLSDASSQRSVSADGMVATMGRDGAREHFYQCCSLEDQEAGLARLRPQPLRGYEEPLALTPDRWGSIPRTYIIALRDLGLPPRLSAFMLELVGAGHVEVIDSDHSSFLSAPTALARILSRVSESGSESSAADVA
jgi:pimeloyl-ACP methyl ester carboxylesterase